jgi:hypothetical protein
LIWLKKAVIAVCLVTQIFSLHSIFL